MSEPALPVLPESLLTLKPKLSGACPFKAILFMYLAALPISLVLGVVAHYLGIIVGYLAGLVALIPNLLTSLCGVVLCVFGIFAFLVIAVVFFGYPFIVGVAGGEIVGQLGKKGHCRNPVVAGWAGALNGIFIYLGHSIVAYVSYGGLHPMTVTIKMFEDLFDTVIYGTPWWMTVLVVLEFAIVLIGAASLANGAIGESAYCETHSAWYAKWKQSRFSVEVAEALASALQTQDVHELETAVQMKEETYPHLIIKTRGCPSGPSCDVEVAATVFWHETKVDKKGKTSTKKESKPWFDVMMPAIFGYALEKTMALQENLLNQ
jgi:hypothetical protein